MAAPGSSNAPALVAVHTWRDEAGAHDRLAAQLGLAVLHLPLPPGDQLPSDVAGWVDHHLSTVERHGPWPAGVHLVGWSFGGVVALEMARRLHDRGQRVLVSMVDTTCPRRRPRGAVASFWYHLGEAAHLPAGAARRRYLTRWAGRIVKQRGYSVRWLARRVARRLGLRPGGAPVRGPADLLTRCIHRCYLGYEASHVEFPVHLLVTETSRRRQFGDPSLGWSRWLRGGFEVDQVPGDHYDLFAGVHLGAIGSAVSRHRRAAHLGHQVHQGGAEIGKYRHAQ